jgi:hypothetical protein
LQLDAVATHLDCIDPILIAIAITTTGDDDGVNTIVGSRRLQAEFVQQES